MTSTAQDRTIAIAPAVQSVRRHARLAVVVALVVFLLTAVAVMAYPVKAKATATVQLYQVAGGLSTTSTVPVNVSTEARTGASELVLKKASELLNGSPSAAELSRQLEVDAPDGSQNLMFTVKGSSGEKSAERANAVAQAYLDFSKERAQAVVKSGEDRLNALLEKAKVDPELGKNVVQLELALAEQQQINVVPGQVVDPAQAPTRSWLPTIAVAFFAGLALGAIAGVAAALVRDRMARNTIDAGRLAAVTGLDVLDWDGEQEGVRRLMDRLARTRPGVPAVVLTGEPRATQALLEGMVAVENERQRDADADAISDPLVIDSGLATQSLLLAAERRSVLLSVDTQLGMSRFVRLAEVAVPVLVANAQTPLAPLLDSVDQLADARYGVEIVFAKAPNSRRPANNAAPSADAPQTQAPSGRRAGKRAAEAPQPAPSAPSADAVGLAASVAAPAVTAPAAASPGVAVAAAVDAAASGINAAPTMDPASQSAQARAARHASPVQPAQNTAAAAAEQADTTVVVQRQSPAALDATPAPDVTPLQAPGLIGPAANPAADPAANPPARARGKIRATRPGWKGATSR